MTGDNRYTQEQLIEMQISINTLDSLVKGAIENTGRNAGKLEILVNHHQILKDEITLMKSTQLTRDDISELLEISVNAAIVSGFKKLLWAVLIAATGVIVTILTSPFNFK